MRTLLTGGAGFFGSHLTEALLRQGHSVHILDLPSAPIVGPIAGNVTFHEGDLLETSTVREAIVRSKPNVVFHLAAVVNLDRSLEVADACMKVNALGTLNLLRVLEARPPTALVLASTTEVYGDGPVPFKEEQAAAPPSPYAVSKLAAEQLALSMHRITGFPTVVARIATAYGPRQPNHRLIPTLIESYARGERPSLSDPELSRDFLFVDDVVEGLVAAAESTASHGEIINLGNQTSHTIGHIAETVRDLMGADLAPCYGARASRPNEARVWASNTDKARRLLGWSPKTTLLEGLERTITWFLTDARLSSEHPA